MEDSILKSVKAALGLDAAFEAFDEEVIIQINSAFSSVYQLGVGTAAPISDDTALWSSLALPAAQLNMVKTLIILRVKMGFDPPQTSYLIEAAENQIREQEWRLSEFVNLAS
jgi:hypothetical protein